MAQIPVPLVPQHPSEEEYAAYAEWEKWEENLRRREPVPRPQPPIDSDQWAHSVGEMWLLEKQEDFRLACVNEDEAAIRLAVEQSADANAAVYSGRGYWAARMEIGYGMWPYASCTAAFAAAAHGKCGVLGVLLAAPVEADPNKGNTYHGSPIGGWTPLHAACHGGNPDAVTMLLLHGADPHLKSSNRRTPCMLAALCFQTTCLRALAEGTALQGATLDVNELRRRSTALDMALRTNATFAMHERDEVVAYLRELGALRGRAIRRRRAWRKIHLHTRAVGWFVWRYKAAKARIDFAPGGAGVPPVAESFDVARVRLTVRSWVEASEAASEAGAAKRRRLQ